MDDQDSIGHRIAFYRKQRGLTQTALAHEASVSVSLLRKIEQGARDATPVLVAAVAKPLGVDVTELNGQPYDRDGPGRDRIHELIPAVRAMLNYWDLPPELETPARPADQLMIEAVAIAHLRQADRNVEALSRIPAVLLEITAALDATDTRVEQETLYDAAATVLHPTLSILHATGYDDLATIAATRITWVGDRWGNPLVAALGVHTRTSSMLRYGTYDVALRLTERARTDLATLGTDTHALRMTGSLHLRSAILAARAGDAGLAAQHITEARNITSQLPQDTDHLWRNLAFGPTNTGFHDVATAIELGDGPRALTLAERLEVPATFARTRTAHHFMDLARAYLWQGKYDAALACLQRSRKLAPQQTRHHPTAREVTRMLLRAHRHANEPLVRFTAWMNAN